MIPPSVKVPVPAPLLATFRTGAPVSVAAPKVSPYAVSALTLTPLATLSAPAPIESVPSVWTMPAELAVALSE